MKMTGKEQPNAIGFNELQYAIHNGETIDVHVDSKAVNSPSHYTQGRFEAIDEMVIVFGVEATITYCRMCAWKYRKRAPYKNDFFKDQAKADWYLNKACELLSEM